MIEISFGKLLLLAVVALIVLGPERLPHAARTAGALLRRMRSGWDNVRAEVEREIQAEEIKRTLRETAENARSAHDSVRDEIRSAHAGVREDFRSAADTARETGDRVRDTFSDTPANGSAGNAATVGSVEAERVETPGADLDPTRDMLPLNHGEPTPSRNEPHERS